VLVMLLVTEEGDNRGHKKPLLDLLDKKFQVMIKILHKPVISSKAASGIPNNSSKCISLK